MNKNIKFYIILILFVICTLSCTNNKEVKTYYPNGKLHQLYYLDNDSLKQGLATVYYQNGDIQLEKNYVDDKPNGSYIDYYNGGKVKIKGETINGVLVGEVFIYKDNGNLSYKEILDTKGQITKTYYYNEIGKVYLITSNKILIEKEHSIKSFKTNNEIDTLNSNFLKLKRKNNILEIEIINNKKEFKDSIIVYFFNDLFSESNHQEDKSYRSEQFSNTRKVSVRLEDGDFKNGKCNIYVMANHFIECDPEYPSNICIDSEGHFIQFDKDDYDLKDNLHPIY